MNAPEPAEYAERHRVIADDVDRLIKKLREFADREIADTHNTDVHEYHARVRRCKAYDHMANVIEASLRFMTEGALAEVQNES